MITRSSRFSTGGKRFIKKATQLTVGDCFPRHGSGKPTEPAGDLWDEELVSLKRKKKRTLGGKRWDSATRGEGHFLYVNPHMRLMGRTLQ